MYLARRPAVHDCPITAKQSLVVKGTPRNGLFLAISLLLSFRAGSEKFINLFGFFYGVTNPLVNYTVEDWVDILNTVDKRGHNLLTGYLHKCSQIEILIIGANKHPAAHMQFGKH